jgi:hypothetical protein
MIELTGRDLDELDRRVREALDQGTNADIDNMTLKALIEAARQRDALLHGEPR